MTRLEVSASKVMPSGPSTRTGANAAGNQVPPRPVISNVWVTVSPSTPGSKPGGSGPLASPVSAGDVHVVPSKSASAVNRQ